MATLKRLFSGFAALALIAGGSTVMTMVSARLLRLSYPLPKPPLTRRNLAVKSVNR